MRRSASIARCWGCGKPLPAEPFHNPHHLYHDEGCRQLHRRKRAVFNEQNLELPGRGRSPIPAPGAGDVLRVVRLTDGRLGVLFAKGPARRNVREHHGTDSLPLAYYLHPEADESAAVAFLRNSYPWAEVTS